MLQREEAALRPGELTRETAPWNAFFEAVSEHRWEETAVVVQPLPVHPSHDLPTLFCCCGPSLQGPCAKFTQLPPSWVGAGAAPPLRCSPGERWASGRESKDRVKPQTGLDKNFF